MSASGDILAFVRLFGLLERQVVCCGTVSLSQCVALQALAASPRTNAELAEVMGVTRGAVTRLLDGMDARGWIARLRDASDRRRLTVSLTGAGEAEAARLTRLFEASVERLLAELAPKDRPGVERSLRLLREAAESTRDGWMRSD
ncbi:MAG: MarR family transcriptional regulator [Myxococcota bacterium]